LTGPFGFSCVLSCSTQALLQYWFPPLPICRAASGSSTRWTEWVSDAERIAQGRHGGGGTGDSSSARVPRRFDWRRIPATAPTPRRNVRNRRGDQAAARGGKWHVSVAMVSAPSPAPPELDPFQPSNCLTVEQKLRNIRYSMASTLAQCCCRTAPCAGCCRLLCI